MFALALVWSASASVLPARATGVEAILGDHERAPNGLYRIVLEDGTALTTHGPDPARGHGHSIGPGDPERAPLCATDHYQHILYGRLSSQPDRYASVKPTIQASMRRINAVLNEDAIASGAMNADYKVLCDTDGSIRVDRFTASAPDFSTVVDAARAAGFTASNADYSIFFDAAPDGFCGIANVTADERLHQDNANNSGADYAVTYSNCWTNETPMHENAHNQGAVQYNAPDSTGSGWHCYDENDVMCYSPDGGDKHQNGTELICKERITFDCSYDTYFDAGPEPGEYLDGHWNLGSSLNRFIAFQPLKRPPVAAFDVSCSGLACSFTDRSTDEGGVVTWRWDFDDGHTSSTRNASHTFASSGTYTVSLTVTDVDDMSDEVAQTVDVPNHGDPDPATPNLTNGVTYSGVAAQQGGWRYVKIRVPADEQSLTVTLDGARCIGELDSDPFGIPRPPPVACDPDLDLYVRHGQRPDESEWTCRPYRIGNREECSIARPAPGYWYVGVRTDFVTPDIVRADRSFELTARY